MNDMLRQESNEPSLFDKATTAAKAAMGSVVDLANRTRTPIIVYRDGKIEHISATELQQDEADSDAQTAPKRPTSER